MNKVHFNEALCKGCQLCIDACPKKILTLNTKKVNTKGYNPVTCTDMESCTACKICAIICPDSVISIERRAQPDPKEAEEGLAHCSGGAWGSAPL